MAKEVMNNATMANLNKSCLFFLTCITRDQLMGIGMWDNSFLPSGVEKQRVGKGKQNDLLNGKAPFEKRQHEESFGDASISKTDL